MSLSADQIVAAEGAKRLLSDSIFQDTLNHIAADATEKAIIANDPNEREANRQLVLAIGRIRGSLEAAIEYVDSQKQEAQKEKAFE